MGPAVAAFEAEFGEITDEETTAVSRSDRRDAEVVRGP